MTEGYLAMDTSDRSPGALSPWSPSSSPLAPRSNAWGDLPQDEPQGASKALNLGVIVRAIRRHWWQILAIWLVGSTAVVYVAYTKIKPSYEASSYVEVSPPPRALLTASTAGAEGFKTYLDTQVLLVDNPDNIQTAIRKELIRNTAAVRNAIDPVAEIRQAISVSIPQKGTHVIQVRMTDQNAQEAADIVNTVVGTYVETAKENLANNSKTQLDTLLNVRKEFAKKVSDQRAKLKALYNAAGAVPQSSAGDGAEVEKTNGLSGRLQLTLEEVRSLQVELADATIVRHQAEAFVSSLQHEIRAASGSANLSPSSSTLSKPEIEARIEEEFQAIPSVAQLSEQITQLTKQYGFATAKIRKPSSDPAAKRIKQNLEEAEAKYDELWKLNYTAIKAQVEQGKNLSGGQVDQVATARAAELREATKALNNAKIREKFLNDRIEFAKVEVKSATSDNVEAKYAEMDLQYLDGVITAVQRQIDQLEFEGRSDTRIRIVNVATASRQPSSDSRKKMMAAGPAAMLVLAVALFVLIEFRGARVADPDELSRRVKLKVIGVVPPLPSLGGSQRALSVRGQRDEKRRIEEFVQSLDQLRVTLCAHRPGMSPRRCVLITSATGGEGKTTLAAQLAGRCANAGLMTLLIDGDLRRPSLGDLLEVPEGPGFVDVLSGDASPESAMVVIGNAGGFHLLPAGTMGQDPSRLLHGDRLGQLIAQFRETFDIVIIDAPPVLAVPDALLLGRWTDGAVLAVRHDTSRFPLVERANKRLASVGVNVLGAVINGCRSSESAYGSYRYTPYAMADDRGDTGASSHEV